MFVIVGYLVVVGSVIGGYALAGGHIAALLQPVELLMIGGAAIGAFLVSNPRKVLTATLGALPGVLKGSKYTKIRYMQLMAMLYDVLTKARKEGLMSIENDVDEPAESPLFNRYPELNADHHLMEFVTDYLRMMVSGNLNALEIENLMDNEIDTHHHEAMVPSHAIQKVADGRAGRDDRSCARRNLPRHPARLRLRRAARDASRAEGRRGDQGAAVREGHPAREHAGLCSDGLCRVRPQGALFHRAAQLLRARGPRPAEEMTTFSAPIGAR
jgi:hypothetical protein